jgi:2',3'-cyclic-nucleotide 2'-phosphodiesterase (5'-nucleotidase family)
MFKGIPIYEIANRIAPDAFTLGNHDFDYGWQQMAEFRRTAKFPILSANAFGPDGKPLAGATHTILRVNGLRVGIIGVLMSDLLTNYLTPQTAGPIRVEPVVESVRRIAREIAPVTDVLVVLGHISPLDGAAVLREVPEVHVVVEGHSHRGLAEMDQVDGRVRVEGRGYGIEVGRLDLEVDTESRKIRSAKWTKLAVDTAAVQPAPDVDELVRKWEQRVSAVVDRPVAEARRDFDPPDVLKLIEQAMREELGADFAVMNRRGVRDRLPKGTVRERAIWNIMPFDNVMMTARVKGSDVPPQLSRGATLDPQKEYVLALHDFSVGNEAQRRELGVERISFTPTDRVLRDLLIDWVRKKKVLE